MTTANLSLTAAAAANRILHSTAKRCVRCGTRTHGFSRAGVPNCAACSVDGFGGWYTKAVVDPPKPAPVPKIKTRKLPPQSSY